MGESQPALGQGAGLVGADARHPSDVLDHHAAPDERLAPCQAVHADAEEEGEDDRKLLGDRRDRERHRAQERVDRAEPLSQPDHRQHQAHRDGRDQESVHESADGELERRPRVAFRARGADDLAVDRFAAGVGDAHPRPAGEETRPGHGPVLGVEAGLRPRQPGAVERALADGKGLPGERRLVDLQLIARHHQAVGGERLARGDRHQIADHHLENGDGAQCAVALDHRT